MHSSVPSYESEKKIIWTLIEYIGNLRENWYYTIENNKHIHKKIERPRSDQ